MLDIALLESADTSVFTAGPRLSLPFHVDGYYTDGLDSSLHHILVRRADPGGDGVTPLKLFLTSDDPTANATDPNKRRPAISDFEFTAMAQALAANDMAALMGLAQDGKAKTFTRIGGMVLGDGLREVDGGYEARWIQPLRRDDTDNKHRAIIGWTNVQKRSGNRPGYEVECVMAEAATVTTNIDDLIKTLRGIFGQETMGRPGAYLRLFEKTADGAIAKVTIIGGAGQGGGRFERRDRKAGQDWRISTVDEAIEDVLATPAGKSLNVPAWGDKYAVEVIPVLIVNFGDKSIGKHTPDIPFTLPPDAAGQGSATRPAGYGVATVRLTGVVPDGTTEVKFFVAGVAKPTTGDLFRLADLPTEAHAPDVKPVFAVYPKAAGAGNAASDLSKSLDEIPI